MYQAEYVKGPSLTHGPFFIVVIFITVVVGLVADVFMLSFLCNVIITVYAVLTVSILCCFCS
jgi:hypothetical protein